jgi:hypothetical protein
MTTKPTARKCEICGKRNGAITCYRTAMYMLGYTYSYAHMKCFERLRLAHYHLSST